MVEIGPYEGTVAEGYDRAEFFDALARLPELVAEGTVVASGKDLVVRLELGAEHLVVKRFGKEPPWKDRVDEKLGSAAMRSWTAARHLSAHGVGTPRPVAVLEQRRKRRLLESYYISEAVPGAVSLRDALLYLYYEDPVCEKFMSLLDVVAGAVWDMHAAGFQHRDLGNQNILLTPAGDGCWTHPCFIDLNRGRINSALTQTQRGRDVSRLTLPSDLMRAFLDKYCGIVPPRSLIKAERFHRRWYHLHHRTRKIRHPVRESIREKKGGRGYPSPRDAWIWDERSAQAIGVLTSRERRRHYPGMRHVRIAGATLAAVPGVWREYKSCLARCYQDPVRMDDRVGVTVDPRPQRVERELELLAQLGSVPVLMRVYHHESIEDRMLRIRTARELHESGHKISLALVQDRAAVLNPSQWRSFCGDVMESLGDCVEMVEVGHALNRVKWGAWSLEEIGGILAVTTELRERHPDTRISGPACIDFEYPLLIAALGQVPEGERLAALSHHLYVDRRGAPEDKQGRFSLLEKCALAKAIARWSANCDDELIVSEVNWPLAGQGVYSPVGSPYVAPGIRKNDPSVSEDDYADYMLRYLCIAIGSGMVERVFWWRLVARGFGLVDDSEETWRTRPAFEMLKVFLEKTKGFEFRKHLVTRSGLTHFTFAKDGGGEVELLYSAHREIDAEALLEGARLEDAFGKPLDSHGLKIGGRPVYVVRKA
jgi:tRNA A-37 threonylcarbamoyl transferase component Bud32